MFKKVLELKNKINIMEFKSDSITITTNHKKLFTKNELRFTNNHSLTTTH